MERERWKLEDERHKKADDQKKMTDDKKQEAEKAKKEHKDCLEACKKQQGLMRAVCNQHCNKNIRK